LHISADNIVIPENGKGLKICVLQPDYTTSDVDYQYYDPARDLSSLLPEAEFKHVFLNKLTTYKQLRELKKEGFDIFVNLCEGYLDWSIPSVDVIYYMELLGLPFTGPTSILYDPTKDLMKYVAFTAGVKTPPFALISGNENLDAAIAHLQYPLFVKPAKAGDSLGIDDSSLVKNKTDLVTKVNAIIEEYGPLLVEEYIDGREFTVMIAANPYDRSKPYLFKPIEYIFPQNFSFKTYALKTSELHPNANIPVDDTVIVEKLHTATRQIFEGFNGVGYARLDFRMNAKGEIFFLEINFTCSVFYKDGYEGSADYVLREDGLGQKGFLQLIIREGIARYRRTHKPFRLQGNSKAGYGIFATRVIYKGEVIFPGEESAQRIVTKQYVEKHWSEEAREVFRRYAYPISNEVFLLWDNDPNGWAPQNHSCVPNTEYDGLNVNAICDIQIGDELTLDYTTFLDENMEPFECRCGHPTCRGLIKGTPGNSITNIAIRKRNI
jgi:D-alanine-D-alanine ligase-like ATP-grasp enzyme